MSGLPYEPRLPPDMQSLAGCTIDELRVRHSAISGLLEKGYISDAEVKRTLDQIDAFMRELIKEKS